MKSITEYINEVRHSAYNHSKNPLFSKEEADYWDNLELPNDEEYQRILKMTKKCSRYVLWNKLGADKYNAFMLRWEEDDNKAYNEYIIFKEELPF